MAEGRIELALSRLVRENICFTGCGGYLARRSTGADHVEMTLFDTTWNVSTNADDPAHGIKFANDGIGEVADNNSNFTFSNVTISTFDNGADGVHIDGTGNNTFTFDNLTVSTQGNNADGFRVLNDSNNITVQNSTFTNIFDDVFSLTNSTNLSGTGNTATNFNGLLLNDGGGNTGTISFDSVDPDGDGTGAAMTIPIP